jgi:hypothetical protein
MMLSSAEDVSSFVHPNLSEWYFFIVCRPDVDHQFMVLAHCICGIVRKKC